MNVLVVVPVRNRPNMVLEALESIAAQTIPATSIAVVDDGSTDNTAIEVSHWLADRPLLPAHLLRIDHHGASFARNYGLRHIGAVNEAVIFLDSDDLLPEDFLERTVPILEQQQDVIAVSTDQELFDVRENSKRTVDTSGLCTSPWLFMLENGAALASCTLFRAQSILDAGGFPENIPTGHDTVLFGRVAKLGDWCHVPGKPVAFRRNHAQSIRGDADHLHKNYPDYEARWAAATEQLIREAPHCANLGRRGWKLLSKRWRTAAIQAIHNDKRSDAMNCAINAFRSYPWSLRNIRLFFRLLVWSKK